MAKPSTAPHRGETLLRLGGQEYRLVFDYDAIDRLIGEFGAQWETKVTEALIQMTPGALCVIAAIGLRKHHPGVTEDQVRAASPPLVTLAGALAQAIHLATIGPGAGEKTGDDPEGKETGTQKPDAPGLLTQFRKLLAWRSALVSRPANSGRSPPMN